MDWYVDARRPEAVQELRREILAHFSRHAARHDELPGAELAVGELLGNLVKHAPGPAWVSLNWPGDVVALAVVDVGPGFVPGPQADQPPDAFAESGRGLMIVEAVSTVVTAGSRSGGGARVTAEIPLARRQEDSYSPPPSPGDALPGLDEALPQGGFGKESFLRALVVQLGKAVERVAGPAQAERAVAQVGTDVGGQMEDEYRAATRIVDRLTVEQIADCLVRLKGAIDGGFSVSELTDDRIVFVNTACPFGDVVQRAPALCRMTSSVFGGIAARNSDSGSSAVLLEERIAVGDPQCRVVVYLGAPPESVAAYAHRYDVDGSRAPG